MLQTGKTVLNAVCTVLWLVLWAFGLRARAVALRQSMVGAQGKPDSVPRPRRQWVHLQSHYDDCLAMNMVDGCEASDAKVYTCYVILAQSVGGSVPGDR